MQKEEDPDSSDCDEDGTDLICGLIRELSSLKLVHAILLSATSVLASLPIGNLLTFTTISQFNCCPCCDWLGVKHVWSTLPAVDLVWSKMSKRKYVDVRETDI